MPDRKIANVIQDRHFLTSRPEKTIHDIAEDMKRLGADVVLIVASDGLLLGICTEQDMVFRVLAEGLDSRKTPVQAIMTKNPEAIRPEGLFGHALHRMFEGGFRHLPVVDEFGFPLGVVSARDALSMELVRFGDEVEQRMRVVEIL